MRLTQRVRRRDTLCASLLDEARLARTEIRQGRFQRSMAVITSFAAVVSGFEAYTQHQRGAFANRWMWSPVWLMAPVLGSAGAALFSRRVARTLLPVSSAASLLDGVIGFGYHLRGIGRLPGGFELGQYNIVMGPPVFAPLLVGMVGALGLLASSLRPEEFGRLPRQPTRWSWHLPGRRGDVADLQHKVAYGRFQKVMAAITSVFAVLAGGEAYFEHLRGSYNQRIMWTPVWATPPMLAAAAGAVRSPVVARRVLPWTSAVTFLDGLLGFGLHLRGIRRMPGGFGNLAFNVTMGPPLFAPLLFCAVGLLGGIAALLRRQD